MTQTINNTKRQNYFLFSLELGLLPLRLKHGFRYSVPVHKLCLFEQNKPLLAVFEVKAVLEVHKTF